MEANVAESFYTLPRSWFGRCIERKLQGLAEYEKLGFEAIVLHEKVSALVDGKLELPNDISGIVYISLDEGAAWELQLAKEMKQSGYNIDMNKLI